MPDKLKIVCEQCGKVYAVSSKYLGRKERCKKCGHVIAISRDKAMDKDGKATSRTASQIESDTDFINIVQENDIGIVTVSTSRILDQSNIEQFNEELKSVVTNHNLEKIVINLMNVDHMSSAVIGKLVEFYKLLKDRDGQLKFCNIEPNIYEIFEIMRFDKLFDICEDENEAIAELQS